MDTVLYILALVCVVVGVVGCFVPVLPGPPICYVGMLIVYFADKQLTTDQLLLWGVVTVAVTIADYLLPVWFTKRFGGSKYAKWGSMIGIVAGLFFAPWGILIGPFAGALVGELIADSTNSAKAFKVALGSFAAFFFGTGIKLISCVFMAYYIIKAIF